MWFHIWVVSCFSNFLDLCDFPWQDSNVKTYFNSLAILPSGEPEGVIIHKFKFYIAHFLLQHNFVVLFSQNDWLLCQTNVFQNFTQVKYPFTNVVVAFKQIKVPSLQNKLVLVFRSRSFNWEHHSIVEGSFTVLASVVSVRLLLGFIINVNLHEDVACSLVVFARNILSIHHADANFVVKNWFWRNIPDFLFF